MVEKAPGRALLPQQRCGLLRKLQCLIELPCCGQCGAEIRERKALPVGEALAADQIDELAAPCNRFIDITLREYSVDQISQRNGCKARVAYRTLELQAFFPRGARL